MLQVGRQEPVMVLRVDKDKGYIDLSKRCVPASVSPAPLPPACRASSGLCTGPLPGQRAAHRDQCGVARGMRGCTAAEAARAPPPPPADALLPWIVTLQARVPRGHPAV